MITPMRADLTIRRNDNPFRVKFSVKNADGSTYSFVGHGARLQIRQRPGEPGAAKLQALSTASSQTRLVCSAEGIEFIATPGAIGGLPAGPLTGDDLALSYDLLVTPPGGDENAWFEGAVSVRAGVTA